MLINRFDFDTELPSGPTQQGEMKPNKHRTRQRMYLNKAVVYDAESKPSAKYCYTQEVKEQQDPEDPGPLSEI